MVAQSVMFDRSKWDRTKARAWLKRNGFDYAKVDATTNYLRYRQEDPKRACKRGMFRVKEIGKGVKMTLCCRNK